MSAAIPSYEELKKSMKVNQLKDYLRERGKVLKGNKDDLIKRVRLFWNDPVLLNNSISSGSEPRSSTSSHPIQLKIQGPLHCLCEHHCKTRR